MHGGIVTAYIAGEAAAMSVRKSLKKAPANVGAPTSNKETPEQIKERKRARARANREEARKREGQFGSGYDQLHRFLESVAVWKQLGRDHLIDYDLEQAELVAKRIEAYVNHEVQTLDEAFMVHRPKGYQRPAARKRFEKMRMLVLDGRILRQHGAKADVALYEVLGKMHGVGKTQAGEWYNERNKGMKPVSGKTANALPARYARYLDEIEWMPGFRPLGKKSGKTPAA